MAARFILSLDCEGKWGVADHLGAFENRSLTDSRLRHAYRDILAVLDAYQVPATFAFVGIFSQTERQFRRLWPQVEELRSAAPHYLGPVLRDIHQGGEGWHGDWAVDMVGSSRSSHEIALHGVSHVPWTSMDPAAIDHELALFAELEGPVRDSRTFVHPRNLIGHVDRLLGMGMIGYRGAPPVRSRLRSLASELNVLSRPQDDPPRSNPQMIPSGYFVNWKHGPRRLVPTAMSAYRVRRMLHIAARSGRVVHYWLHPENVASEPATLDVLRSIVTEVARQRDVGQCEVLTQIEYCWARGA